MILLVQFNCVQHKHYVLKFLMFDSKIMINIKSCFICKSSEFKIRLADTISVWNEKAERFHTGLLYSFSSRNLLYTIEMCPMTVKYCYKNNQ